KHCCPELSKVEDSSVPDGFLLTEYQENFLPRCTSGTCAAIKPQDEWKPLEGKMENTTMFRCDYVPHKVTRQPPEVPKLYVPPDGTLMLTSTYSADYHEHPVQKHLVAKQTREYCPPATKMVAMSRYKEEFKPWHQERRQPFKTKDNLVVSQDKFVTTTAFKDDFCPKTYTSPRKNFRPTPQIKETLPFDGTTNYKLHYVSHPVQSKQPRKKEKYRPPSASFDGTSTHKQDYKGLPTEVPKPVKPKQAWKSSCASFQATTEFCDQYKPWSRQPKQSHKRENYNPPLGDMTFLSTTHADYVAHQYHPVQRARPPIIAWEKEKEPFQGKSVMKEDYKEWDTVYQISSRYRRKSNTCMPFWSTSRPEPVMKNSTTSYTGKPLELCPASFAEPPGFEYTCDAAGHRLYRTAVTDASLAQGMSSKRFNVFPEAKDLSRQG
ncbi:hypothetical protein NFI96_023865, partial [Prochilodus magdalenae]